MAVLDPGELMSVFRAELVVRGYECGPERTVGLSTVLSYFEHARWLWILQPELGLVDELQAGSFFVVHRATVALARSFGIGTALTVRAALRSVGRVTCEVEQDLVRDDGALLARGWITAVWLGPDGGMRRVPASTRGAVTDAALVAAEAPVRSGDGGYLAPPEEVFDPVVERAATREGPPEGAERRVVEYRGQAVAGDRLDLTTWAQAGGRAFSLSREGAVVCRAVLAGR